MELSESTKLLERARAVIPGGVWGHNRFPAFLAPGKYPYFAASGSGCRFTDVDGNVYVDYLCGYGAMISGYANPLVDGAAQRQAARGDCFSQPTAVSVELAERLVRIVAGADWCAFAKNGADATWMAVLIAFAHTGRSKIVCARGAYHGSHLWCDWCNIGAGRRPELTDRVLLFDWNRPDELEALLQRWGDDVAAVVLTPFHHPIGQPAQEAAPGFWARVSELTRGHGSVLVCDDVRAGFRLSLAGSHAAYGFEPDLVCFSKAIANTHPLAAVTGGAPLYEAAESVFAAGTFWSTSAAMAAALANIDLLERLDGVAHMTDLGERLAGGLVAIGAEHGLEIRITGPVTVPTMTIAGDDDGELMSAFAAEMAAQGSLVHPAHNWFLSNAHTAADVDETLAHAEAAFARLPAIARR